jgi:small subunit ribosomal protein S19e
LGIFDVPAAALIRAVAADLKKQGFSRPSWAEFVKTGSHRERSPDSQDWFFERSASVLYRVYKQGPLGTEALRNYYGGKKRRGVKKPHFRKAGGKILRVCLQQLEKEGLIKKSKKGRVITAKGQGYLNAKAKEAKAFESRPKPKKEEKHEEKTAEEKRVEAELKKQEQAARAKEKAAEDEKKKEKKAEEKKQEKKEES